MKKVFAIMAAVMVLAVSLAGCGNDKRAENSDVQNTQEANYSLPTELTDDLFDYRVQIGEDVLIAPMTLRHLKEAGWTSDEEKYPKISSGADYPIDFEKNNELITVHVKNNTSDTVERLTDKGAAQITVESVGCSANPNINTKPVRLPKGITSGVSTIDDVVAAYGEPQNIEEQYAVGGGNRCGYVYIYYEGEKLDNYKNADRYMAISIGYFGDKVKEKEWTVTGVQLHAVS